MHIVIGLIIAAVGFLVVWKANWMVDNFGHMAWAERSLGVFGGTRTVIKTVAVFAIFIGFLYMTNQINSFLDFAFGWIVPPGLKDL